MKDKIIEALSIALIIGFAGFLADMAVRLNKAEGSISVNGDKLEIIRIDVKDLKNCLIFKKCEVSQ